MSGTFVGSEDPAMIVANVIHTIIYRRLMAPKMVLKGQKPENYKTSFLVLSRRCDHSIKPSIPSITFSVEGMPGPFIRDLLRGQVVDIPEEYPFHDSGRRVSYVTVDLVSNLCAAAQVDILTRCIGSLRGRAK